VGRYGVNVEAIDRVGVTALHRAMDGGRIVIIDEIGKMELFSSAFKEAVLQAVSGPHTVVATAMAKPNPWIEALLTLPTVTVWKVTTENRDEIPERVLRWLERSEAARGKKRSGGE